MARRTDTKTGEPPAHPPHSMPSARPGVPRREHSCDSAWYSHGVPSPSRRLVSSGRSAVLSQSSIFWAKAKNRILEFNGLQTPPNSRKSNFATEPLRVPPRRHVVAATIWKLTGPPSYRSSLLYGRTPANRNRSDSSNVPGCALGKEGVQRLWRRMESLLRRTRPMSTSATMVLPTGPRCSPPPATVPPPRPGCNTTAVCGSGTRLHAVHPPVALGHSGPGPQLRPPQFPLV